jgi:UDP-N-acetylmuramoylalanine--D-glutamate ligase
VVGDVDLFVAAATAPVVGITGSNAKSTVTALVGEMAGAAGLNVGVGGNLGPPALDLLSPERELYVVELSSFQLERAGRLDLKLATVLNISADHLDRHGSMPRYHQAKHRIFRGCQTAVVNRDDPLTVPLLEDAVKVISWGMGEPDLDNFGLRQIDGVEFLCRGFEPILASAALPLPGRHNIANALAALAIGHGIGLPLDAMQAGLAGFRGLPHRCQLVLEAGGVRWVNDSKGTNVGATEAALRGLGGDQDLILIAGGQAKGADFAALKQPLAAHGRLLLTIGEDAQRIEDALGDTVATRRAGSLEEAVVIALEESRDGDTVLLSPACASFDMFASYIDRGEQFSELVRRHAGVGA